MIWQFNFIETTLFLFGFHNLKKVTIQKWKKSIFDFIIFLEEKKKIKKNSKIKKIETLSFTEK